jgi:hypothetical protein
MQSMAVKIVETILTFKSEMIEPAQVETLLELTKQLIAGTLGVEVDDEVCLHKCLNAQKQPCCNHVSQIAEAHGEQSAHDMFACCAASHSGVVQ